MKLESMIEYGERCYAQGAKQARTMTPVSERLPEKYGIYLIRDRNGVLSRFTYKDGWYAFDDNPFVDEITHWMELPEVPG